MGLFTQTSRTPVAHKAGKNGRVKYKQKKDLFFGPIGQMAVKFEDDGVYTTCYFHKEDSEIKNGIRFVDEYYLTPQLKDMCCNIMIDVETLKCNSCQKNWGF